MVDVRGHVMQHSITLLQVQTVLTESGGVPGCGLDEKTDDSPTKPGASKIFSTEGHIQKNIQRAEPLTRGQVHRFTSSVLKVVKSINCR